ncbi:MAG: hypothetical protein ACKO3P_19410 [Planctomycetaceae bacterium]
MTMAGGEIGFVEDFVLAPDRGVALGKLIPGTEEYYYYTALHLLSNEQYEKVPPLVEAWVQRHQETPKVWEIRTRLSLLTHAKDPQATLGHLQRRLGLGFPHAREDLSAEPNFPTELNPEEISRAAYTSRAHAATNNTTVDGFEDIALEWLLSEKLNPAQRRTLLSRLGRPDLAELVPAIVEDLQAPNSGGFGSLGIHGQLLLPQLEELVRLRPEFLNHQAVVRTWLTRLQPSADADWRNDAAQLQAHLTRIATFANRLEPVHNSLKAHVKYHQLLLDWQAGKPNRALFIEYLKLPRRLSYVAPRRLESEEMQRFACDLGLNYDGTTLLPPIGNDEPLVRSYLLHFLKDLGNPAEFEPWINNDYLKALFAEAKLTNGLGNVEQWASLLSPAAYKQLKERVDLDFEPTNSREYTANQPVTLQVSVKNVPTLIVKVFEINTEAFYRRAVREVDTDINLDGLVPNSEETYQYADASERRIVRRFEFPQCAGPGVYVIDFIGNGRSSRALIRKGRLRAVTRNGPTGQVLTVIDEAGKRVPGARAWIKGREYLANNRGQVAIPYSTSPGLTPVVLTSGRLSCLDQFDHQSEQYTLMAGLHVDREALLSRREAQLLVRPGLFANGEPVSLKRLEGVILEIRGTDLDGVATTREVPDFPLFEDRETVHAFQVPARLASLEFVLRAKVRNLSQGGEQQTVAASHLVTLNEIERTDSTEDLHLVPVAGGFILELRGKMGEPKGGRPVQVTLRHREFRQPFALSLKSDKDGRIKLGALRDIAELSASGPQRTTHNWRLPVDAHTYGPSLHGRVGEPLSVPFLPGPGQELSRQEVSLLELRGDSFTLDRFENLRVEGGLLRLENLPAGDFDLWVKRVNARIRVRITTGNLEEGLAIGPNRVLEMPRLAPVQIAEMQVAEGELRLALSNHSRFTRVHVLASRFAPEYGAFDGLSRVRGRAPFVLIPSRPQTAYLTGRSLGDEYTYILDRKRRRPLPGNMLERPSLLLNPWAIRDTQTSRQEAAEGGEFGARGVPAPSAMAADAPSDARMAAPAGNFTNLDFLHEASVLVANLVPDEQGRLAVPLDALGAHQHLVVAAVDPLHTTVRTLSLPEHELVSRDLRLLAGFDSTQHFTQQRLISVVRPPKTFEMTDITTGRYEVYDSLRRVHSLDSTLTSNPALDEFAPLINWPKLSAEEQAAFYSKYSSHELNFFLFHKDRAYFDRVIRPYLKNKRHKTFLDLWLLGEDLAEWRDPWRHAQLNTVEQILLARRIAEERVVTARLISERLQLLPPNPARFVELFETAAKGSELSVESLDETNAVLQKAGRPGAGEPFGRRLLRSGGPMGGGGMGGLGGAMSAPPGAAAAPAPREMREESEASSKRERGAAKSESEALGRSRDRETNRAADKLAEKQRKGLSERRSGAQLGDAKDAAPENAPQPESRFFDADLADLGVEQLRALFRQPESTREWAENNYHHLLIQQQNGSLISVNAFWRDFAQHDPAQPFLSRNIAEATGSFAEMLLALSVLDLPFESSENKLTIEGTKLTLSPGGPAIVFHEELRRAEAREPAGRILVGQSYFRHGDRHQIIDGEQVDKYVTEEFLVHTVYGCQVVITNPNSSRQSLSLLLQVPQGAIPVLNGRPTRTALVTLEPYHTQTLDYYFYFPAAGDFPHFPVQVARKEELVAFAPPFVCHVVDKPSKIDTGSWQYLSQFGTTQQVLEFLGANNVSGLDLERIAWRMHDAAVFDQVTTLLATRHVYSHSLWSYALKHNRLPQAREFLQHAEPLINECGGRLRSPLLTIDPVLRRSFQHLEYKPLYNARAHQLGRRRQIVNDRFHAQYHDWLKQAAYDRELSNDDRLTATYYLLLQDRIEEAQAQFAQVSAEDLPGPLLYDYCAAYLEFFSDRPDAAREIAERHAKHPVDRWRNLFQTVLAQLDEAAGRDPQVIDPRDRNQQQGALAATEPGAELTIERDELLVQYRHVPTFEVNYYLMDLELLFSRNPFAQGYQGQFSAIRPNRSERVVVGAGDQKDQPASGTRRVPLPDDLKKRNVLVEVVAAGETRSQPHYANSLAVQLIENFGQVKVTRAEAAQPVPKAYVKVYAQLASGEVKFYKDGYTDLRGKFDYASLSTGDLEGVTRFSILILSDEFGSVVREALPPKR